MSEILGAIRVSPAVVRSLVSLTARECPGVVSVGRKRSSRIPALPQESVRVRFRDLVVDVDVDLTVDAAANVVEVGRRVQRAIGSAIETALGLEVGEVNVRVQDVS